MTLSTGVKIRMIARRQEQNRKRTPVPRRCLNSVLLSGSIRIFSEPSQERTRQSRTDLDPSLGRYLPARQSSGGPMQTEKLVGRLPQGPIPTARLNNTRYRSVQSPRFQTGHIARNEIPGMTVSRFQMPQSQESTPCMQTEL